MSPLEDLPEDRWRAPLWIGAIGATVTALAGMFGLHDASVWRLPGVLEARVEAALQGAGYPGLDVEMDGQRAILHGIVPDEAAIARAHAAALTAAGAGGSWSGGVTSVDATGLSVGAIERPFAWRFERRDDSVVLTGAVPSEAARVELLNAALAAFPNAERVDQMRVAGGAPAARWTAMAGNLIRAVGRLGAGEARLHDAQIALIGDGPYEEVERLRADFAAPPAPFRAVLAISVDGLDLALPELQGVDLRGGRPQVCTSAFARLLEERPVSFAAGSASLQAESLPALDALASVALRCDRGVVFVRGPGDDGAALSRQRAETVVNHFASLGVARERLRPLPGVARGLVIAIDAAPEAGP